MTVLGTPNANGGRIELRDAEVHYLPGWLPAARADALFGVLSAQVP